MKFELGGDGASTILEAIRRLALKSERISIAVSYIQLSGWDLLKTELETQVKQLRILCTDQFGITDPNAVREIIGYGADVRAFKGNVVFHPKVYIGSPKSGSDLFVLGSANLSRSALLTGVEADLSGEDAKGELAAWFDSYFTSGAMSAAFDDERLAALDIAFAARAKSNIAFKRSNQPSKKKISSADSKAANADMIESVFASLKSGVTPLNFDKAGNNIRQLHQILEMLQGPMPLTGKTKSEMKLLGLADSSGGLTSIGSEAAKSKSIHELAKIWMAWLKHTDDKTLAVVSPSGQLKRAMLAFERFWALPAEVTGYFIAHAAHHDAKDKRTRRILQTIELVANAGRKPPALTLDDIEILSGALEDTSALTPEAAKAVAGYLANKGMRGWEVKDRRLAVMAFRDAA